MLNFKLKRLICMKYKVSIFVLVLLFYGTMNAQVNRDKFVEEFVLCMQKGQELKQFVIIPDSILYEPYMINFVSIEDYHIEKVDAYNYKVHIDPGIGKICVTIELRIIYDDGKELKLESGGVRFNHVINKYFIDPWLARNSSC